VVFAVHGHLAEARSGVHARQGHEDAEHEQDRERDHGLSIDRAMRFFRPAIVLLVATESAFWLFGASVTWAFRGLIVGVDSPQAAENAKVAVGLFIGGVANALALVPFLFRREWGWWLLVIAQALEIVVTAGLAISISDGWWLSAAAGVFALGLLLLLMRTERQAAVNP